MFRGLQFATAADQEWGYDETGEPVTPGGRALAVEIAAALATAGCRTSDVEQHEYYGWAFDASLGDERFYNVINAIDHEVHLGIETVGGVLRRLFRGPGSGFGRYCELVAEVVARLPGVSEVRWDPNP